MRSKHHEIGILAHKAKRFGENLDRITTMCKDFWYVGLIFLRFLASKGISRKFCFMKFWTNW